MSQMTPREIVEELDKHIIGQSDAKRAVAIALRNRWRRAQVTDEFLRSEITPKNILMIGPQVWERPKSQGGSPDWQKRRLSRSKQPNLLKSDTSAVKSTP